MLRVVLQ